MGLPFGKSMLSGVIGGFKKDLEKDGVHIDQIAAKAEALEKKIEPLAHKFNPDMKLINAMFYSNSLTPEEEAMAKAIFHDAMNFEHEFTVIAGKLGHLIEG